MITAYYEVFNGKLKKLKEKLKKELKESKSNRDKKLIKELLREAKHLRNSLKKMNKIQKFCCPKCNHEFEIK